MGWPVPGQGKPELTTEGEKTESQALLKHHTDACSSTREIFLRLRDRVTVKRERERRRKRTGEKKRFPASKLPPLSITLTKLVKGIGPTVKMEQSLHCH